VPTLVEKPLSHDLFGVDEIIEEARRRNACVAVGYNLRSSVAVLAVRALVQSGTIGRLFSLRAHVGQDLASWRVGQDPRKSISASQQTGGGALLELSHELDLALWICGAATHVVAETRRVGANAVDVEDMAEVLISHSGDIVSSVHLDLLARPARRSLVISGEEGMIVYDLLTGWLHIGRSSGWESRHYEEGLAASYNRQMEAFLDAARNGTTVPVDLCAARDALRLAVSARTSAETGRRERVVVTDGGSSAEDPSA
jgi:predicted dehydrogenase